MGSGSVSGGCSRGRRGRRCVGRSPQARAGVRAASPSWLRERPPPDSSRRRRPHRRGAGSRRTNSTRDRARGGEELEGHIASGEDHPPRVAVGGGEAQRGEERRGRVEVSRGQVRRGAIHHGPRVVRGHTAGRSKPAGGARAAATGAAFRRPLLSRTSERAPTSGSNCSATRTSQRTRSQKAGPTDQRHFAALDTLVRPSSRDLRHELTQGARHPPRRSRPGMYRKVSTKSVRDWSRWSMRIRYHL